MVKSQIISENFQLAEKEYIKTNKLNEEELSLILDITNKDGFTKYICDIMFYYIIPELKKHKKTLSGMESQVKEFLKNAYNVVSNYKSTLFPIKDFNIIIYNENLRAMLDIRDGILYEFKSLPSIALRNCIDKKIIRNMEEFEKFNEEFEDFLILYKNMKRSYTFEDEKIFKSGNGVKEWTDFLNNIKEDESEEFDLYDDDDVKYLVKKSSMELLYSSGGYYLLKSDDYRDMMKFGCNSDWCFSQKGYGAGARHGYFANFSYNMTVYGIINLNYELSDDYSKRYVITLPFLDESGKVQSEWLKIYNEQNIQLSINEAKKLWKTFLSNFDKKTQGKIKKEIIQWGFHNKDSLKENYQMMEKNYIKTGKLSQLEIDIILNVSEKGTLSNYLSDVYVTYLKPLIQARNYDLETDTDIQEILTERLLEIKNYILNYTPSIFGIKNFNILDGKSIDPEVFDFRDSILNTIKKLPSIAFRNMKEKKQQYDKQEIIDLESKVTTFDTKLHNFFKEYGFRFDDREVQNDLNTMFSSNKGIDEWNEYLENWIINSEDDYHFDNLSSNNINELIEQSQNIKIIIQNKKYMLLDVDNSQDIKLIGCNSNWCFSKKGLARIDKSYWNSYSYNGHVMILVLLNEKPDSNRFMELYIRPLETELNERNLPRSDGYEEKVKEIGLLPPERYIYYMNNTRMSLLIAIDDLYDFYMTLTTSEKQTLHQFNESWIYEYRNDDEYEED